MSDIRTVGTKTDRQQPLPYRVRRSRKKSSLFDPHKTGIVNRCQLPDRTHQFMPTVEYHQNTLSQPWDCAYFFNAVSA
jgi:hypothetical protein